MQDVINFKIYFLSSCRAMVDREREREREKARERQRERDRERGRNTKMSIPRERKELLK